MFRNCWLLAVLLLWLPMQVARADALVLVHGYLGDANSWFESGVAQVLQRAGWRFGGFLVPGPQGVSIRGEGSGKNRYYVMTLPSEAPFEIQLRLFEPMLKAVRKRHSEERLSIVGHSLGGVLARYAMVLHPDLKVDDLITIASPHLGTNKAELALLAGSTPLSMMAPMFGAGTINRSRGLYSELVREAPGTFLYWLNHQKHPDAHYFSVIRKDDGGISLGDMVVPEASQDMNKVAALRGRSYTRHSASGHGLEAEDGRNILLALQYSR
jgi:pimeloyl-ACP methyl ester carboxylesterase